MLKTDRMAAMVLWKPWASQFIDFCAPMVRRGWAEAGDDLAKIDHTGVARLCRVGDLAIRAAARADQGFQRGSASPLCSVEEIHTIWRTWPDSLESLARLDRFAAEAHMMRTACERDGSLARAEGTVAPGPDGFCWNAAAAGVADVRTRVWRRVDTVLYRRVDDHTIESSNLMGWMLRPAAGDDYPMSQTVLNYAPILFTFRSDEVAHNVLVTRQDARRIGDACVHTAGILGEPGYQRADFFPKGLRARIRAASGSGRAVKRVRKIVRDGVNYFSVADVREHWPQDFE